MYWSERRLTRYACSPFCSEPVAALSHTQKLIAFLIIAAGRALMFCCCFFLFFLQREISVVSRPIAAKRCHMIGNGCNLKKTMSKIWGSSPQKNWGPKTCFLARFRTTLHFDREYLRNGTRYRQHWKTPFANCDHSHVC